MTLEQNEGSKHPKNTSGTRGGHELDREDSVSSRNKLQNTKEGLNNFKS